MQEAFTVIAGQGADVCNQLAHLDLFSSVVLNPLGPPVGSQNNFLEGCDGMINCASQGFGHFYKISNMYDTLDNMSSFDLEQTSKHIM